MTEFMLLFRRDFQTKESPLTPEQIQASMKPWQDWMGSIAAQNKLVSPGARLQPGGNVVRPNKVVTDGPYTEIKESLGGYIVIRANDLEEATEIAKGCPVLILDGNVEVRAVMPGV